MISEMKAPARLSYGTIPNLVELEDLIATQIESFAWFRSEGLRELFDEINPITDYTGKNFELRFLDYEFGPPKFSVAECRIRDMTYAAPLRIRTRLTVKETGEIKESEVYMGDFAMMTDEGTFIVNGTERVVVSQLVRSPGVYFTAVDDLATGRRLFGAKLIPNRGAWLEIETSSKDLITVKIDRKRKVPVTVLLKALELPSLKGTDNDREAQRRAFQELFGDVDQNPEHHYLDSTFDKDTTARADDALLELYRRVRPGDPPSVDNARNLLQSLFFSPRRFDLGRVGRYKVDKRLGRDRDDIEERVQQRELRIMEKGDFIAILRKLIELNNTARERQIADDIDHLGNRRVRAVGELLQNQFRMGLIRMERIIKERMTISDPNTVTAASLINARPVVAAIKEFFGSSQLSQFMDQVNPLAELTHKRRLNALGPGGLSRERAGFDVRDVHHSHYGPICPIETPEGPNNGLIGSLATFARVNEFGFIETPFRRVYNRLSMNQTLSQDRGRLEGRVLRRPAVDSAGQEVLAVGATLDAAAIAKLEQAGVQSIDVKPWASAEVAYLSADEEDLYSIAQANAALNPDGTFRDTRVPTRLLDRYAVTDANNIQFMDVSPKQIVSVATAMIPFLEHDDANRALMGSNMQRQAVPLMVTESPMVGTGVEHFAAKYSGEMLVADVAGTVLDVALPQELKGVHANPLFDVVVRPDDGSTDRRYPLQKFYRSNQGTCLNQRVVVKPGQTVEVGDILADGPAIDNGEMALGRNVLVAFMPWEGYNFEDAILLSQSIVQEDKYTSIHIEEFEIEARETKLGPEEITRDIPNVADDALRNLDERGIVYIGAEVEQGDILVGKITPKGETELSAEERLLRAIFGEKAREVRDSSLRVPHGERGIVVDVKVMSRENKDELSPGVTELVRVYIAQKRKISAGDKMAGRHGNKGVVARVLPIEDMPFMPDGTAVEIVLNPLGVPSRMNLGQVLETHLGWISKVIGTDIQTPVFDGAPLELIERELGSHGLPRSGKVALRDGRSGAAFEQPVTVGWIYMLKLHHLVEDKIHARSTGPYSLVTQQPLGGKAQFGGQRFGEMEVWALEAYGAAHVLQEILTVKSDDIVGRVKAYEAIVKGDNTLEASIPESFRVLVKELQGLALGVEILSEDEREIVLSEEDMPELPLDLGINLERDELVDDTSE
ncbi:MAG: DNA-directed RNA polymerase subunit beta [Candidatus Dormibacteraeota bacterium]|nr:DNA-directed RNA polymerase subunit beta [Candidatus Dormibacteraeota bacterium]